MIKTKQEIIEKLKNYSDDDLFEFSKKTEKTSRSLAQNRYYFGVVVRMVSDHHGYTVVEAHELIKQCFSLKTTTGLSKVEFMQIIELIRDYWNAKFNFYIPLPNEVKELKYYEKYFS